MRVSDQDTARCVPTYSVLILDTNYLILDTNYSILATQYFSDPFCRPDIFPFFSSRHSREPTRGEGWNLIVQVSPS